MGPSVLRRTLAISALTIAAMMACAAPAPAQTATPRIIGGGDVAITKYPFQVRLRIRPLSGGSYLCGGSIIDPSHVVTAAHCVVNDDTSRVVLPAGQIDVYYGSDQQSQQTKQIASAVKAPAEYTSHLDDSYDVAQITLAPALPVTSTTKPIPFVNAAQPKDAGNAFVTGFGVTSSGSTSPTLRGVTVPLRPDLSCAAAFTEYEPLRSVCAGGGSAARDNPDTCNGDSGGPLVVDLDNRTTATNYALLGLTSYGTVECGKQNTPAVYTYLQGPGVRSFFDAGVGTDSASYTSGNFEPVPRGPTAAPAAPSPAPAAAAAVSGPIAADRTKPQARVSKVRCKHRRCSIRLRASDSGGGKVKKLSVRIRGKVRKCRAAGFGVSCRTVRTRTKKPRARKVAGGYKVTIKLRPGRYSLTAVATDTSGNRSKTARKRFRVRR